MKKQKSFTPHLLEGKKERISSKPLKKGEGFTLIELMVVISIIGLLSGIVLVSIKGVRDKARIAKSLQFSSSVHHALGSNVSGFWSFDESGNGTCSSGEDFCDSSGFKNDGRNINSVSRITHDISQLKNAYDKYAHFNGSNYIRIDHDKELNAASEITITAWFRLETSGGLYNIVDKSKYEGQYRFGIRDSTPRVYLWVGDPNYIGHRSDPIPLNEWIYVVFFASIDSATGDYKIGGYVNGEKISTLTGNSSGFHFNLNNDEDVTIGSSNFRGDIDEVRIYKEILSETKIKKNYAEGAEKHGLLAEE